MDLPINLSNTFKMLHELHKCQEKLAEGRHKGQALIECALSMWIIMIIVSGIFIFIYLYFAKLWINHHVQEFLICSTSVQTSMNCHDKAITQIARFLPFGKIVKLSLNTSKSVATAKCVWRGPGDFKIVESQQVALPLKGGL